jgi:hypothetical protein
VDDFDKRVVRGSKIVVIVQVHTHEGPASVDLKFDITVMGPTYSRRDVGWDRSGVKEHVRVAGRGGVALIARGRVHAVVRGSDEGFRGAAAAEETARRTDVVRSGK